MTRVVLNPGTWDIEDSCVEGARINMNQLVIDCNFHLTDVTIHEIQGGHRGGRFRFSVSRIGYNGVIIDMPGCKLDSVRYMGFDYQDIWDFPRLYIDGSSYVWKYVIGLMREDLNTKLTANEENNV